MAPCLPIRSARDFRGGACQTGLCHVPGRRALSPPDDVIGKGVNNTQRSMAANEVVLLSSPRAKARYHGACAVSVHSQRKIIISRDNADRQLNEGEEKKREEG